MLTAILGLAVTTAVAPAHAEVVTYSTAISFDGGAFASVNTLSLPGDGGTMTLTFQGVTNLSGTVGSVSSLGTLEAGGFSWFSNVSGHTFDLRITQAAPSTGSGDVTGTLNGGIGWTGSFATMSFASGAHIGGILYEIAQNPSLILPPPDSPSTSPPGGVVTIGANLVSNPEPSTLLLVGTGLTGLGGIIRRRIARR